MKKNTSKRRRKRRSRFLFWPPKVLPKWLSQRNGKETDPKTETETETLIEHTLPPEKRLFGSKPFR